MTCFNSKNFKFICFAFYSLPTLLSDDMRREIIRKNWEKEVEQTLDKPMGPIHYQDVLFEGEKKYIVSPVRTVYFSTCLNLTYVVSITK